LPCHRHMWRWMLYLYAVYICNHAALTLQRNILYLEICFQSILNWHGDDESIVYYASQNILILWVSVSLKLKGEIFFVIRLLCRISRANIHRVLHENIVENGNVSHLFGYLVHFCCFALDFVLNLKHSSESSAFRAATLPLPCWKAAFLRFISLLKVNIESKLYYTYRLWNFSQIFRMANKFIRLASVQRRRSNWRPPARSWSDCRIGSFFQKSVWHCTV
jgi:hypothetical protein